MNRNQNSFLWIALISLALLHAACNKVPLYPDEPILTEGSFELLKNSIGQDTAVLIKFKFTDGDGDLGLTAADTIPPYDKNLFVAYFQKVDGKFEKIVLPGTTDTLNFNSRIRDYNITGANAAQAEVALNINISVVLADTIMFEYYLRDKALNVSNKLSTGPIALN
jgi:hypothetical protein